MNKSLEFNFWSILYNSIVFLCLQTPEIYLKLNVLTYRSCKLQKFVAYYFHPPCIYVVIDKALCHLW